MVLAPVEALAELAEGLDGAILGGEPGLVPRNQVLPDEAVLLQADPALLDDVSAVHLPARRVLRDREREAPGAAARRRRGGRNHGGPVVGPELRDDEAPAQGR